MEQIGAHKFILIARSPVFFAMLCGDLAELNNEPIRVPDIEPSAFRQMLMWVCLKVTASSVPTDVSSSGATHDESLSSIDCDGKGHSK